MLISGQSPPGGVLQDRWYIRRSDFQITTLIFKQFFHHFEVFFLLRNVGYEVTAEDPDKLLIFTFGPRKSAKFLIFGPEKILSKGKKEFTTIVEGRGGGKGNQDS